MNADGALSEPYTQTRADREYSEVLNQIREALEPSSPDGEELWLRLDRVVGDRLLEQHARTARFLGAETTVDEEIIETDDPLVAAHVIVALAEADLADENWLQS